MPATKLTDPEALVADYRTGMYSLADVGNRHGVTRQRAHQVVRGRDPGYARPPRPAPRRDAADRAAAAACRCGVCGGPVVRAARGRAGQRTCSVGCADAWRVLWRVLTGAAGAAAGFHQRSRARAVAAHAVSEGWGPVVSALGARRLAQAAAWAEEGGYGPYLPPSLRPGGTSAARAAGP